MGFIDNLSKGLSGIIVGIAKVEDRKTYLENHGYKCEDCSHMWVSKKAIGSPFKCPSCNSRNIRRVIVEFTDKFHTGIKCY
jgi:predicted Zn-ribbon and HTH transcriptional regulator